MQRLETERERPVMHRDQSLRAQFQKSSYRLFGIHVNFTACRRLVGANGKQCQVDPEAIANFFEAREISCVATMKNRAAVRCDHKASEIAVQIRKEPGSPVVTGRERNLEWPELDGLPVVKFVHDVKPETVDQVSHARWNHDRLVRSYAAQRTPVEVIKMRMRHEYEVNGRQMMDFEARLFQPLDDLEPFRPNRIDQDVYLVRLDEKGGVTDPGNADLAFANLRKLRWHVFAGSFYEQRWD